MNQNYAIIVALLAALLAPLLTFIVASRKLSGKIATSEATDLWTESSRIREEYRERLKQTEVRQAALEARVAALEMANADLARENLSLTMEAFKKDAIVEDLGKRLDAANTTIAELKARLP